jgi:uncharacterized protein GlcG (DUF336 family)
MIRPLLLAVSFALAAPAAAQAPYTATTISVAQADAMMTAAVKEAGARKLALAIVVVDEAGRIVLARRMDGALPHAFELAHRKARTAALIRASTTAAQESFAKGDHTLLAIDGMLPIAGGLPVKYDGRTLGAIGVSGSPPASDEAVAAAGLAALAR